MIRNIRNTLTNGSPKVTIALAGAETLTGRTMTAAGDFGVAIAGAAAAACEIFIPWNSIISLTIDELPVEPERAPYDSGEE